MSYLKLLASNNYIPLNRELVKLFGIEEALILGELCSEYDYWRSEDKLIDGMFYCSINKLEEATTLSEYQQRKAIKNLENLGVIKTKLKKIPATRYFYIDEDKLFSFLRSSSEKTSELDTKKLSSSNNYNNKNYNKKLSISKDIDNTPDFEFGKKKEPKQSMYSKCIALIDDFTDDSLVRELLTLFLQRCLENSRESGTPFYTNNFKGKLNTLKTLTDDHGYTDSDLARKIVVQTLDNGWNSFYELKTNQNKNRSVSSDMGRSNKSNSTYKKQMKEDIASGRAEKF